jgi:putative ABC transport system permease protein
VKALDRKLLRDLRLMWSQALTIALVVASGIAGFITTFSAYDALAWTREIFYEEARFADVFSSFKRAPVSLLRKIEALPGVAQAQAVLRHDVPVDLPGVPDPIIGRLIGLDIRRPPTLNQLHLLRGQMIAPHHSGPLQALVSVGFAEGRNVQPGDRVQALINGKREQLQIVGVVTSPEYIFAGLAGSPDQRGFGVFWVDHEALAAAYNESGAFNSVAVRLAPQALEGEVIDGLDRLLGPYGGVNAHGRDLQMSHRMLESEIKEQRVLGTVLPAIFLGVAGFLLNVVLSRQISTQREQIAALKALGYNNLAVGTHYLKLVLIIVAVGVIVGLALGAWAGHWFSGIYAGVFRFPEMHYRVKPELVLVSIGVALVAAVVGTLNAIGATVRLAPAEAMRPPAPPQYRPLLLERIGLRKWLSPAARMVLRAMERRYIRTLLTVVGIAFALAVVVTGSFWRDSIDYMIETQFEHVLRSDVQMSLIEATQADVLNDVRRLPGVTDVEGIRTVAVRLVNGHRDYRTALQGMPQEPRLRQIMDVAKRTSAPPADGLLITDRLGERLAVKPGDILRVELQEGERAVLQIPVRGMVNEMMGLSAYIERRALNRLLKEDDLVNQIFVSVDANRETEFLTRLKELPRIVGAMSNTVLLRNVREVTARNMLVFSAILTAFACVIAVGVVYNNARIALAERAWELASLRVLGFTRAEVSGFLLGELALEILFAIPVGATLGYGLALTIVNLIKTDEFYFPLIIAPRTYVFAALCVIAAGLISALIVRRRIDRLDLVAVLKTRE